MITQLAERVEISVMLDDKDLFHDVMTFCDARHAEGQFADMFHEVTLGRYREPTQAIPKFNRLLEAERITNASK
jgi:hypothetical protein